MKRYILLALVLVFSVLLYPGSGFADMELNEAYGIISRTLVVEEKVVVMPTHRNFTRDMKVLFHDDEGFFICSGVVLKSYPDMVYVSVKKEDMERLEKGCIVSQEGKKATIRSISRYSKNIEMVMKNSVKGFQNVPLNNNVLNYIIDKKRDPVVFHHYSHNYRCTECHHSHHNAIDHRCSNCHNNRIFKEIIAKDVADFPDLVRKKCTECHPENNLLRAER